LWKLGAEPVVVLSARGPTWDFSPDSRKCAVVDSEAHQIRIHDPETGRELRRFPYEGEVAILRWNPRRPVLAIASPTGWRTISVETGEVVAEAAVPGCNRLDWHPEGRLLAVDTPDRKIRLWDTVTCKPVLPSFDGHKTLGIVYRFNHAGDRLLSTDWHGVWRLWDTRTGQELLTLPAGDRCLRFSADDRLVAAAWESGSSVRLYRFLGGSECRTVVHHNLTTGEITGGCVIDAEGRLLAYPTRDGLALVDMVHSQEGELLPLPGNGPLQFEPKGEALWTFGRAGLLRWPLHTDSADKERRVGPPQAAFPMATYGVWWSSNPEVTLVTTPCPNGAVLWQRAANRTLTLTPQGDVRFCAVSPDGRWVATGSWWVGDGVAVKVWDAHSAKHVATLPVASRSAVRFSPDGKWLLTSGGGARIWRTDTWQQGPALRSDPRWSFGTFSSDSELLALDDVSGVRLVRTATGNEVARLIDPEQAHLSPQCFTPDGSRLITSHSGGEALHIFDLRAIREQLQALKLDWDAPPFPPAAKDQPPLQVTGDLGPFAPEVQALLAQSDVLRSKGNLVGALAARQKAHALVPDDNLVNNFLGWMLVVCPEPEKRNAKQALVLAKKAVGAAPGDWRNWRTLGVAHHLAGDDRAAVTALTRSLELHQSGEAFEYFPLAAAHQQLGNKEEARKWYDQGVAWMTANKTPLVAELAVLRADAEAVLGIANKQSGR
jgi:WD40 repeat protein